MHIRDDEAHAVNVIGAWALALADAINAATTAVTGITGAAPAAIVAIAADPEMTIDELRRALQLTHPGAVRLVDRLEGCGWLERRPGRGRTIHLCLTTQGRSTHRRLLDARSKAIETMTATLDREAIQRVAELISPSLTAAAPDNDRLRHLCRLCRRPDCDPCPVAAGVGRPH